MLINLNNIISMLLDNNITINGVLHVGAHECEEMGFYNNYLKIPDSNIIWIEANEQKVKEQKKKNIPNIYEAVISDKDDEIVEFNIANNGQSSSILKFGTHSVEHPDVKYIKKVLKNTITLDTFFKKNKLDQSLCEFLNFDIQGAELLALKGATDIIKNYAKAIYVEVNEKELYLKNAFISDIDEYLLTYNFKRVLTNMTRHGWGDALYIKI